VAIPTYPVRYDTSVALAVNHADLPAPNFDIMDARVWTTLTKLENYFLDAYPVNAGKRIGPAIGRHKGDNYFGGNAFYFLTAAYAELSFRLASETATTRGKLIADDNRVSTLRRVLNYEVKRGSKIALPDTKLANAFAEEGDAFIKTMLDSIPEDGTLSEQSSKVDGSPVSAKKLSWSYASILTAILQREEWHRSSVDYAKLDFACTLEESNNLE
jgi:glucoamylase